MPKRRDLKPSRAERAFGNAIKKAREAAGLTQAQLSAKLLVDTMTISRWERGEVTPRRFLMKALADTLPNLAANSAFKKAG